MNLNEILLFVGLPVVVATVIILMGGIIPALKNYRSVVAIVALGISCMVAFVLQEGVPTVPPQQKWHWLVLTVIAVWGLACIYPWFKKWDDLIVFQAMIAGLIAAIIMQFPSQDSVLYRVLVFFMVLFVSVGLRRITIPAWHLYVVSWWVLVGLSVLALQASFAKLAFFSGAMSAVAAALCVLHLIKPGETKSIQMVFGVLIVGCSLCGLAYDQSEQIHQAVWFLPMIGIPISSIAFLLFQKKKYAAIISLGVVDLFVCAAVIWSLIATPVPDDLWP